MADWVIVVDDKVSNLRLAGNILSMNNMRVTALQSGKALLEYVRGKKPDLILLDAMMPEMDGFETLRRLYDGAPASERIPVIFLTADENGESETMGLALGAMDFIRKPFVPEALTLRVRHTIELVRLQRNLAWEVEQKTREIREMSLSIVEALAAAIDAKDSYTNGHSLRVAKYAEEIARRCGYSEKRRQDIYIMGLLHDVGKIGVPDKVINKPGKLTDEEYEIIKTHPVIGENILRVVKSSMPGILTGARYHHERYDGKGYPDGLSGENIPTEARLIAVADAYDAMASRRSYRDALPQAVIRSEIEKGAGRQFDPVFAGVMLDMIDEDTEYRMREA